MVWIVKGKDSDKIVLSVKDTNSDNIPDQLIEEKIIETDLNEENKLLQHQLWMKIPLSIEEFELIPLLSNNAKILAFTSNKRFDIIDYYESDSDIAILKLSSQLDFDSYVGPACLPPRDFHPENFGSIDSIVSGWGLIGECGSTSQNYA